MFDKRGVTGWIHFSNDQGRIGTGGNTGADALLLARIGDQHADKPLCGETRQVQAIRQPMSAVQHLLFARRIVRWLAQSALQTSGDGRQPTPQREQAQHVVVDPVDAVAGAAQQQLRQLIWQRQRAGRGLLGWRHARILRALDSAGC